VLVALAFGVSDERAAAAMGVSHRTYTRRVRALMDRAGVGTRFELACWARDRGRL
jgi:DNA-binding NarL/FixJ family response regulator